MHNYFKKNVKLTDVQKDILIGTILGDACLEWGKTYKNARLRFDQTFPNHASYLMHIFSHFYDLSGKGPKVSFRKADKRTGKVYSSVHFKTLVFPCFNYYYDLFYKNGKKFIPDNIIELLNARVLAYWICDDGGKGSNNETHLYTLSLPIMKFYY